MVKQDKLRSLKGELNLYHTRAALVRGTVCLEEWWDSEKQILPCFFWLWQQLNLMNQNSAFIERVFSRSSTYQHLVLSSILMLAPSCFSFCRFQSAFNDQQNSAHEDLVETTMLVLTNARVVESKKIYIRAFVDGDISTDDDSVRTDSGSGAGVDGRAREKEV